MSANKDQKTAYKWFWIWDMKKEEAWLNTMAMNGWALKKVGFIKYTFEKCERGEYIVRNEFRKTVKGTEDYASFIEELDAEYIGRVKSMIYFRRKAELGNFELGSDNASKLKQLNAMANSAKVAIAVNIVIGIINSTMNSNAARFSWMNLVFAAFLAYGLGKINARREDIETEKMLFE